MKRGEGRERKTEETIKKTRTERTHSELKPPTIFSHRLPFSFTGCVFGYDFDKTYVQETLSTRFGYACGESRGSTRILHATLAGNLLGCILFGALADK